MFPGFAVPSHASLPIGARERCKVAGKAVATTAAAPGWRSTARPELGEAIDEIVQLASLAFDLETKSFFRELLFVGLPKASFRFREFGANCFKLRFLILKYSQVANMARMSDTRRTILVDKLHFATG